MRINAEENVAQYVPFRLRRFVSAGGLNTFIATIAPMFQASEKPKTKVRTHVLVTTYMADRFTTRPTRSLTISNAATIKSMIIQIGSALAGGGGGGGGAGTPPAAATMAAGTGANGSGCAAMRVRRRPRTCASVPPAGTGGANAAATAESSASVRTALTQANNCAQFIASSSRTLSATCGARYDEI